MHSSHNPRILFTSIAAFVLLGACTKTELPATPAESAEPQLDSLVTTEWLSEHLDDPNLVVLDCTVLVDIDENGAMRTLSGRADYESGHIPSAGFADLMGDLSGLDSPLTFTMPTLEQFSAAMGALGVGEDSTVVLYTANFPDWAARVWWMLRWAGFDRVALLDGGQQAWVADGRALSTVPADRPAKQFVATVRPEMIADRDQVFAATEKNDVRIIDAMTDAHFRGEFSMYSRPGHIPGATNLPSSDLLNAEGHYWSLDELEMMHGGNRDGRVITYCGGGVAASSVAFTMHRLGFNDVAVYMGSLQEWTVDPANPMTLGTQ